jgi:hypothetical protein
MRKKAARESAFFCEPDLVSLSLQARFCKPGFAGLLASGFFIAGFYHEPEINQTQRLRPESAICRIGGSVHRLL